MGTKNSKIEKFKKDFKAIQKKYDFGKEWDNKVKILLNKNKELFSLFFEKSFKFDVENCDIVICFKGFLSTCGLDNINHLEGLIDMLFDCYDWELSSIGVLDNYCELIYRRH